METKRTPLIAAAPDLLECAYMMKDYLVKNGLSDSVMGKALDIAIKKATK